MALTVGLAVAAVPTAAGAAVPQPPPDYVPGPPDLTVAPGTVPPGTIVTGVGSGFLPGEIATITVTTTGLPVAAPAAGTARRSDGTVVAMAAVAYAPITTPPSELTGRTPPRRFTVQVDAAGAFTFKYRVTRPGVWTFTATGNSSGRRASASVTVIAGPPTHKPTHRPPHHLPVTGSSLGTPLKVGGGLLAAGAVMVLLTMAWRRRRFDTGTR
ncbi:hypothetical protein [Micromonospora sp. PLK6-60]|uniref:hypothetical protein n=1 Tax=Micromonospora sp. PLK6-60 TaxID=2873383 RepID=UPI002102C01A|nr:hypothetical protein [Micromonospora sp. PLK6-60]